MYGWLVSRIGIEVTAVTHDPKPPVGASAHHPPRRRRGLIVTFGMVILLAFGYLAVSAFTDAVVYYRTPTEIASLAGEHVRLSGTIVPGSIASTSDNGITFNVTDGSTIVSVTYAGTRPAALRDGGEIVADGEVGPSGVSFVAQNLITKCPSKFDSQSGSDDG